MRTWVKEGTDKDVVVDYMAQIQGQSSMMELLTDNASDTAIFLLDQNGCITSWNPGASKIYGYQSSEIIGHDYAMLFTGEDRAIKEPQRQLQAAATKSRADDVRWHVRRGGARFWADGVIYPLYDQARRIHGFGVITRDTTERKLSEARLAALYEKESRIAETLQRSMLQMTPSGKFPGLLVSTLYEAALDEAKVGGDFFDAFALTPDTVALVVGDVSGKGLLAAARTAEIKYALRAFLHEFVSPAPSLAHLNEFICDTQHLDDSNDDTFIVVTLAVIDTSTGKTTFSAAGAEPPIILRTDNTVDFVGVSGRPLGVAPNAIYEEDIVSLKTNDTIIMATDGITEARQGGEFLGGEGIAQMLAEIGSDAPLQQIVQSIYEGACKYAGGTLRDDACLLLARWV